MKIRKIYAEEIPLVAIRMAAKMGMSKCGEDLLIAGFFEESKSVHLRTIQVLDSGFMVSHIPTS